MNKPHYLADILHAIADGKKIQERRLASKQKSARIGMTTPTPVKADGWVDISPRRVYDLIEAAEDDDDTIPSGHFRIKPATIVVNGIEVPEPIRGAPASGELCFIADTTYLDHPRSISWDGGTIHSMWLNHGLIHTTESNAELHSNALLAASKVQE